MQKIFVEVRRTPKSESEQQLLSPRIWQLWQPKQLHGQPHFSRNSFIALGRSQPRIKWSCISQAAASSVSVCIWHPSKLLILHHKWNFSKHILGQMNLKWCLLLVWKHFCFAGIQLFNADTQVTKITSIKIQRYVLTLRIWSTLTDSASDEVQKKRLSKFIRIELSSFRKCPNFTLLFLLENVEFLAKRWVKKTVRQMWS